MFVLTWYICRRITPVKAKTASTDKDEYEDEEARDERDAHKYTVRALVWYARCDRLVFANPVCLATYP